MMGQTVVGKTIAIVQSNYLPWPGYFALMAAVDEFVLLDTVQFTKNDWRNRNRIMGPSGPVWLTLPIRTAGRLRQRICDAEISEPDWAARHWRTVEQAYRRAPFFDDYAAELQAAYLADPSEVRLGEVNRRFIDLVAQWLRIDTRLSASQSYPGSPDRVERLIGICRAAGATHYLSGPRAAGYLDRVRLAEAGIQVAFAQYADADEAARFSVLDLLFTAGPRSREQVDLVLRTPEPG